MHSRALWDPWWVQNTQSGSDICVRMLPLHLRAKLWATVASTGTEHVIFVFHGAQMKTLSGHCIGNFVLLLIPHYFCTANLEARLERVKWITADYLGIPGHWICEFRVSWGTKRSFTPSGAAFLPRWGHEHCSQHCTHKQHVCALVWTVLVASLWGEGYSRRWE